MQIKDLGAKAGVVLNPGTSIDSIEYVLDSVDLILVMSGKLIEAVLLAIFYIFTNGLYACLSAVNPGFGGQKFIPSQIDKIRKLRQMCNERGVDPWIEVDGGVSGANAHQVDISFQTSTSQQAGTS